MTVRGDTTALLMSRFGFDDKLANEVANAVFECINDPNFAFAYAKFTQEDDQNEQCIRYWDVVAFLKTLDN